MPALNPNFINPGDTYHNFKIIRTVQITELQCILREIVHEPTGAHVMHIANDDPENLFCLSFQTLPYSSNGVAHILEHTVLCGSKKYPIKDPFFAMNRRSLNTFMNALTGADFTCYPAATQVHKDFYNLLGVYLDAVFNPNLDERSFMQEGHRLEFSIPDDPASPLQYKGIVYNEMKGSLSSPSARLSEALNASIFPDITYGWNSGGDPKVIPQLTYEQLKEFHKTFYHPSRCLFYFYGNMPLEPHLDFIAEQTLTHATKAIPLPGVPLQPRFQNPVYQDLTYPTASDDDLRYKTLIGFGWLTCHILEQKDTLALCILEIMLLGTDASPLKYALLQSGWCKQVSSFIDLELSEIPWGIILKGCDNLHVDDLENLLKHNLKQISQDGIPLPIIESAMHQLEFHRSEITGDHVPFGLSLFMRAALLKQHGADPELGLTIHSLFNELHQTILANPRYFSDLIDKYLLNNPHFSRIIMIPDQNQGVEENENERKILKEIQNALTDSQKQQLVMRAEELYAFQKVQEEGDFDILPKVSLDDIPLLTKDYVLNQHQTGHLTVFHHPVFTNGILYADFAYNLPHFTREELPYLRLLTILLTQMGCADRDYKENLDYMLSHTGGINASISLNLKAVDHNLFTPSFNIRGKALHRKIPKLLTLIRELVLDAKLKDPKRLKEIILKQYTAMEHRINSSALKYAINLSASGLNQPSMMANDLYGYGFYLMIQNLVKNYETLKHDLMNQLLSIYERITNVHCPHLILSCDHDSYNKLVGNQFYGLSEMGIADPLQWETDYQLPVVESQGIIIASPVAFIGHAIPTISYTHPAAPALNLCSHLFDNLTLHKRIREQGGAYGGGSVSNPMSGNFYFYSYRDPNVVSTLHGFHEAIETLIDGEFDDHDIEEAKLEMIQSLDAPLSPGSQGEVAYGWWREGRTFEIRQSFRNALLRLDKPSIIHAAKEYILPEINKGATVVFSDKELLEKANQILLATHQQPLVIHEA